MAYSPKFEDGTLVVINNPDYPHHGFVGLYEFRGSQYETCQVTQGCSAVFVYPADVETYSDYKHGRPPMDKQ